MGSIVCQGKSFCRNAAQGLASPRIAQKNIQPPLIKRKLTHSNPCSAEKYNSQLIYVKD